MTKIHFALVATFLTILMPVPIGIANCALADDNDAENAIKAVGGEVGYLNRETDLEVTEEDEIKKTKSELIKVVRFVNTNLTDYGLAELTRELKQINPMKLDLRFTKVTGIDPGAEVWQSLDLSNLDDLDLSSTPVNVRDLHKLQSISTGKLKYLKLNYNRLIFEEFTQFIKAAAIHNPHIYISLSSVSMVERRSEWSAENSAAYQERILPGDEWLNKLVADEQIQAQFWKGLDVSDIGLTDDALTNSLTKLTNLVEINLSGNKKVTDAGLIFLQGVELRLMSSVNDVSGIPREGKNLIIVAAVDDVLHFRTFDGDGKTVVDTDEKRLTEQVRQIEDLRKRLEKLWPPHDLTGSEKRQVITAVTSIVGHTLQDNGRSKIVTRLDLSGTQASDRSLGYLTEYTNLKNLRLSNTKVTDQGLAPLLRQQPELTKLDLSGTRTLVQNDVQVAIGKLKKLRVLNLSGTGVDDAGLKTIWDGQSGLTEPTLDALEPAPRDKLEGTVKKTYAVVPTTFNDGLLEWLDISKTTVTSKGLLGDNASAGVRFNLRALAYTDTGITAGLINRYNAISRSFGPLTKADWKNVSQLDNGAPLAPPRPATNISR
jgi:Leucine Rich repeat